MMIKKGDLYFADLSPVVGSEQGGIRPVLVVQNDVGNKYSPTIIVAAVTSQMNKAKLPTHVEIDSMRYDIVKDSVILLEQLRTIDKKRLKDKVCHLDNEIDAANNGLSKNSVVLMEQLRTIDKRRLKERIGTLDSELIPDVNHALGVSLGITEIR